MRWPKVLRAADTESAVEAATDEAMEDGADDEAAKVKQAGVSIQRYKGLGEMNADQLWGDNYEARKSRVTTSKHRRCREGRCNF